MLPDHVLQSGPIPQLGAGFNVSMAPVHQGDEYRAPGMGSQGMVLINVMQPMTTQVRDDTRKGPLQTLLQEMEPTGPQNQGQTAPGVAQASDSSRGGGIFGGMSNLFTFGGQHWSRRIQPWQF